jgi:hypothetical protein
VPRRNVAVIVAVMQFIGIIILSIEAVASMCFGVYLFIEWMQQPDAIYFSWSGTLAFCGKMILFISVIPRTSLYIIKKIVPDENPGK